MQRSDELFSSHSQILLLPIFFPQSEGPFSKPQHWFCKEEMKWRDEEKNGYLQFKERELRGIMKEKIPFIFYHVALVLNWYVTNTIYISIPVIRR